MKLFKVLCFITALIGCQSFGNSLPSVAVLESIHHPGHRDNIVDIIGASNTHVYLTDIKSNITYIETLRKISYGKETIVNLSIQSCTFVLKERALIEQMIVDGKIVIVAGGNKDGTYKNCPTIYPAGYNIKGLIVAGYSNGHHKNVDIFNKSRHCIKRNKCMTGSSQATAYTSKMALKMLKQGMSVQSIINKLDKN